MKITKQSNSKSSDIFITVLKNELDKEDYSLFYCCAAALANSYMKDLKYGTNCTDINTYRRLRLVNFIIYKFFLPFTTDDVWREVVEDYVSPTGETNLNKKMFEFLEEYSCITLLDFKALYVYAQKVCTCCIKTPPHIILWNGTDDFLLWTTGDTNPILDR